MSPALLPLWAVLAANPAPAAELPAQVQALFEEKGEDGKPILAEKERAVLAGLPPHTLALIGQGLEALVIGGAEHLKVLLSLELSPQAAELVFSDNCILCHSDAEAQKKANLMSPDPKASGSPEHLSLKEFLSDAHFRRGLSCAGCHGGTPKDEVMADEISERWPKRAERRAERSWVIDFCGRCHADPAFMRGFNPSLATDQVAKYKESKHGQLLLEKKDSKAAHCLSCHGVHGIRGPKSRQSMVHPKRIPETCGACHADARYMAGYRKEDGTQLLTNQLQEYRRSVHGKALLEKGDLGAPACNDCHGNHAAMPPKVASVSQVCRTCHALNGTLFDGSKHKQAFEKHGWPECDQCHGKHAIAKANDELISDHPQGLCGQCHAEHAKDKPECNEAARYFRATLEELSQKVRSEEPKVEDLAERGLDIEPITTTMAELEEAIVQSRTRVHAFDRGAFDLGAKPGREAVKKIDQLFADAWAEYRFRRNGLWVAIGAMAFLAAALALKIRKLNRR